jgi:pyruvate-formate lyase-activating enzyme
MSQSKKSNRPRRFRAVFANPQGALADHPALDLLGRSWNAMVRPHPVEMLPLPPDSKLFFMPRTVPVAWDPDQQALRDLRAQGGKAMFGAAAFLAPGYTRTLLPAIRPLTGYTTLPLWAYTAVGWHQGRFWVPAVQVDTSERWQPKFYDDRKLAPLVKKMRLALPQNRLVRHLAHCAINSHCFNAKNLFLGRWEMPLPTSPACNAACVGCISHQAKESACSSPMHRITFVPTVEEMTALAVPHLETARDAIASFGQGCEGEPLLQARLIEKTVQVIRQRTSRGTLHMNTNGSVPRAVKRLCQAGMDSFRFSLNSAQAKLYEQYFRPHGYRFTDVVQSIRTAKEQGAFVSLNLLVFPGFTDREEEIAALYRLIEKTGVNMVQLRNLNIDPELFVNAMPGPRGECRGIYRFIQDLKKDFPRLMIGYYNRTKEEFAGKG